MSEKNTQPQGSTPAPALSPELIQMLAAMQAKAQTGTAAMPPVQRAPLKRQEIALKVAKYIGQKLQNGTHHVDRFVNFVVKPSDPLRNDVLQTARTPILFGTYVIIIFFVFGGLWASLAPLDSASSAQGTVISSSKLQKLAFSENGTISAIYVKEGQEVKAGDKLVALDELKTKASYDTLLNQYRTALASHARLIAERDELKVVTFPEELLKDADDSEIAKILHTQKTLFQSKIDSLALILGGLESRKEATIKGYAVIAERVRASKELIKKGFIAKAALQEFETKEAQYKSELANIESEILRTKSDSTTKILSELKDTQVHLSEVRERFNQAKDSLDHAVLTATVDGIVNHLHVNTVGGVIGAGQPVVDISPANDKLIIEAKVPPAQIDSVHTGLQANIRFSAFKSRTTPTFIGTVISLSHDVVLDQNPAGQKDPYYYSALIEIDMDEFDKVAKARGIKLQPGMGADVQIVTGERTLLRYLLDPLTDTMFKSLKEK